MTPYRALYGALDNRHDRLEWSGPGEPSSRLLGLTDKPQGRLGPDDRWWPSVGCGPVGDLWCVWWTVPDHEAKRAGMVRSAVAAWPLADVADIDLSAAMQTLAGEPLADVPEDWLAGFAEHVLRGDDPPVVPDLDRWPSLLGALWPRLWPEARRSFAARVMLGPAQSTHPQPIVALATPPSHAARWSSGRRVEPIDPAEISRAARWLVGEPDAAIADLMADGVKLGPQPGALRRLARAAEHIETMHAAPSFDHAMAAARTLAVTAPAADHARVSKTAAVAALVRALPDASDSDLLKLRNLDRSALPDLAPLIERIERRTDALGPDLPAERIEGLLDAVDDERSRTWWRDAVGAAIERRLADPDGRWTGATLGWLAAGATRISRRLGRSKDIETRLLSGPERRLNDRRLLKAAADRGWSRLHARVALLALTARAALEAQVKVGAHLDLVVDGVPGEAAVEAAVAVPALVEAVARRTARAPDLLAALQPASTGWRRLWAAHVRLGGMLWPPGVSPNGAGPALLDAALAGELPPALFATFDRLGPSALDHPRRAELWDHLSGGARSTLLDATAAALVERCRSAVRPMPEPTLARAAVKRARSSDALTRGYKPEPHLVATLLSWDARLDAREATRWLRRGPNRDWAPVAVTVGEALLKRRWRDVAKDLYGGWIWDELTRPGLLVCRALFSSWRRARLEYHHNRTPETRQALSTSLIDRVGDVGAQLMPDDDKLENLWHKIGGRRESLPSSSTPAVRWREAARLANSGAIDGGLTALVAGLQDDFPHSTELKDLRRSLDEQRS